METFQINSSALSPKIKDIYDIYSSMLLSFEKNRLEPYLSHYDIKRNFELEFEKDLLKLWRNSLHQAYHVFFKSNPSFKNIDSKYRIFYCPSSKILDSKYRYYLGSDPHLYGWNTVGQVLEEQLYDWNPYYSKEWVFYVYHCIRLLSQKIYQGESITLFNGLLPVEILQKMDRLEKVVENKVEINNVYQKFLEKTIEHNDLFEYEFRYPRNLAMLVQKQYAPFVNFVMDRTIKSKLVSFIMRGLEKTRGQKFTSQLVVKKDIEDRILQLYSQNKIPLPNHFQLELKQHINSLWSDSKVITALSNYPNSSWKTSNLIHGVPESRWLIISENNEPISPLFPTELMVDKKIFPTTLHLAYFYLFKGLGLSEVDAYHRLYREGQGFIDFYKCDVDYQVDQILFKRGKELVYRWIHKKCDLEPNFKRELVLTHNFSKLTFHEPVDAFLSTTYGDILLLYRKQFQKKRPDEYQRLVFLKTFTSNVKLISVLEEFYIHIHNSLDIACSELEFKKNLNSIKNLIKIIYPSLYVLYKNNKSTLKFNNLTFMSNLCVESNLFLLKLLESIVIFYKDVHGSKPKDFKDTVQKVGLLYQLAPKKNIESIEKILGKNLIEVSIDPVNSSIEKMFQVTVTGPIRRTLGEVVLRLHKNRSFLQY